MYLFISKNEIQPYNGEVLKRYIGKKLVKTIANPTEEQLKEFGYMKLAETKQPEYNQETQCLVCEYEVIDGKIHCKYTVEDIPPMEEQDEYI